MRAPAAHYPAGLGPAYGLVSGASAPTALGGTNGEPHISNSFMWPDPVMLAAKAKLTVRGSIDAPLRSFLSKLDGPGTKQVPDGKGGFVTIDNWYVIRISHWGPRYLQLRGGRSSS